MAIQPGLCQSWSEIPKTGFLTARLKCTLKDCPFLQTRPCWVNCVSKAPSLVFDYLYIIFHNQQIFLFSWKLWWPLLRNRSFRNPEKYNGAASWRVCLLHTRKTRRLSSTCPSLLFSFALQFLYPNFQSAASQRQFVAWSDLVLKTENKFSPATRLNAL